MWQKYNHEPQLNEEKECLKKAPCIAFSLYLSVACGHWHYCQFGHHLILIKQSGDLSYDRLLRSGLLQMDENVA